MVNQMYEIPTDKDILITKENCPKCDMVKSKVPPETLKKVEIFDATSVCGMTLLSYYERYGDDNVQFPILITKEEEVIEGAIKIKNAIIKRNGD